MITQTKTTIISIELPPPLSVINHAPQLRYEPINQFALKARENARTLGSVLITRAMLDHILVTATGKL